MRAVSLLYHDVIVSGDHEPSGFSHPAGRKYKLEKEEFLLQIAGIHKAIPFIPVTVADLGNVSQLHELFMLTFDDGGISAHTHISDVLDQYGWKAHFFVVTDYIGQPGFLNEGQIRDLRNRGHIIGTHSCSHPDRMCDGGWTQIIDEWATSITRLSDILGEQVTSASVPGGYYSRTVAQAASLAGVKVLFTSEPVRSSWMVDNCRVFGRYAIRSGMGPQAGVGFVRGRCWRSFNQYLFWNTRKIVKIAAGNLYIEFRAFILGRSHG